MEYIESSPTPDESDRATRLEMLSNLESLNEVRERVKPESHPDFDGETCLDCGDSLPKERLEMGRIRCTKCQSIIEHNNKQRRH